MTDHNKSQLYQEIEWLFTSLTHAEHTEIQVQDGKVVESKYHKKMKDTSCYICDIIRKMKKTVLTEIEKHESIKSD